MADLPHNLTVPVLLLWLALSFSSCTGNSSVPCNTNQSCVDVQLRIKDEKSNPVQSGEIHIVQSREHYNYEKTSVARIQNGRVHLTFTSDDIQNAFYTSSRDQKLQLHIKTNNTVYRSEKYPYTSFFDAFPEIFRDVGKITSQENTSPVALRLKPLTQRTIVVKDEHGTPRKKKPVSIGVIHETVGHCGVIKGHSKGTYLTDQQGTISVKTFGTPRLYIEETVYKLYDHDAFDRAYEPLYDRFIMDFHKNTSVSLRWEPPESKSYRIHVKNPGSNQYSLWACINGYQCGADCANIMRYKEETQSLEGEFAISLYEDYEIRKYQTNVDGKEKGKTVTELTPKQIRTLAEERSITISADKE